MPVVQVGVVEDQVGELVFLILLLLLVVAVVVTIAQGINQGWMAAREVVQVGMGVRVVLVILHQQLLHKVFRVAMVEVRIKEPVVAVHQKLVMLVVQARQDMVEMVH